MVYRKIIVRSCFLIFSGFSALFSVDLLANSSIDTRERKAFRVCQDPGNLPLSNKKGEGYDNKIAELFAKSLGLPLEYHFLPQRMNFIRNSLKFKLPEQDYLCDIVMSAPIGFDQVSVTKPVYRSVYMLVFEPKNGLEQVNDEASFLALPPEKIKSLKIGVNTKEPTSYWLAENNLIDQGVPYQGLNPILAWYPGQMIEKDLAQGKIDVALVWGPIAGYYTKKSNGRFKAIPLHTTKKLRLDYAFGMGVRYGEKEWKNTIESLIDKHHKEIIQILRDYGVPLLGKDGKLLP